MAHPCKNGSIEQGLAQETQSVYGKEIMAINAYLQINEICNQKCLFCNRPPNIMEANPFSLEGLKRRVDDICSDPDVTRIIFTGGEPTLHPYLKEIIEYAAKKVEKIEIQTNGTILDRRKMEDLKSAGLSIINYAFHSHNKETSYTLRGVRFGYEKIENGLLDAIASGLEVHVIFVINKINFRELPEFIDYLKSIGVGGPGFCLNLSIVVPEGWAWENKEIVVPRMADIKPYLIKACLKCVEHDINFDISEFVPLCIVPGFEDRAVSTASLVTRTRILDESFKDDSGKMLDFSNIDPDRSLKAPQCQECSLSSICSGFYSRLGDLYGVDDYEPSTLDPNEIMSRYNELEQ